MSKYASILNLQRALSNIWQEFLSRLGGKQDAIDDLVDIRSGAAAGATALQEHQPLKTINNQSLIGQGDIHIDGGDAGQVSELIDPVTGDTAVSVIPYEKRGVAKKAVRIEANSIFFQVRNKTRTQNFNVQELFETTRNTKAELKKEKNSMPDYAWWQKSNQVYKGERVFFASKESLGWECKRDLNFSDWKVEIDSKTLNDSVNYGWDVFIGDEEYYVESQEELEALPEGMKFVSLAQLFAFEDEETGTIKNWDEDVATQPFLIYYKHNRWHRTTITVGKIRIKYHFLEVDVRKNDIYRGSWRTFPAPPKIEGFYTFDDLEELDQYICYAYFAKRSSMIQRWQGGKIHTNRFRKIITYRDKISWIIKQNNIRRVIGLLHPSLTIELTNYFIRVVIGEFYNRTGGTKKLYPISQCYIANIYVNRSERSLYIKRISGNMLMKQLF